MSAKKIRDDASSSEAEESSAPASKFEGKPGGGDVPTKKARSARASEPAQETQDTEAYRFDDVHPDDFTGLAWQMIEVARRLGEGRPRPATASVRRLLTSIVLSGLAKHDYAHTGNWLVSRIQQERATIRKRLGGRYPALRKRETSFDTIVQTMPLAAATMTEKLHEVLDHARRLAQESQDSKVRVRVGARHLLGAVVRRTEEPTNVDVVFEELGLDPADVRSAMIASLRSWQVPDDPEVWIRLLDPVDVQGGGRRLPTYASDSTTGPDLIGITREVEAMASLVSAWAVEPPLSIGLFGEWGSGKSFFMQKMKERVHQISRQARESGVGQREFGYYKNIVQVEFNAWHYVEGNLWASLVEHIFTNLRLEGTNDPNVDSEANIQLRLERLLGEVREKSEAALKIDANARRLSEDARKAKEEAEGRAIALEQEAADSRALATVADAERATAQGQADDAQRTAEASAQERRKIDLKDLLDEVAGSQELRDQVRTGLAQLGITKERLQTVEDLRGALREAADTGTLIAQGVGILKSEKQPWRLLLWILIVPALVAGGTWVVGWLAHQQDSSWLQSVIGVVTAVSAVPAFLVGAWKKYGPKLKPVLETIERMKQVRADLEARVEAARKQRSEKAAALDLEAEKKRNEAEEHRRRAAAKMLEAETQRQAAAAKQAAAAAMALKADQARRDADKLAHEADLLRPERRIASFIQDRAAAKDYRRHLGVPAIIRRDFEKLASMFHTQRNAERDGKDGGGNDLAIVNRIVLYIDDLDRCPPQKVVEVLQAIHLLLAFPLFVVVVAVDARWMKRSLKNQFSLMLAGDDGSRNGGSGNGTASDLHEKEDPFDGRATADDYLEKIFQVPFWIRPLGSGACRNLVRNLTAEDVERVQEKQPAPDQETNLGPGHEQSSKQEETSSNQPEKEQSNSGSGGDSGKDEEQESKTGKTFDWSPVEPKPRTLQISETEREYMVSLATVIGRSPRSVKRFVNCYRLLKSAMDPAELARSTRDGTFRTTMLLLGIVSGLPEIAPQLLTDLRAAKPDTAPDAWAREVAERLELDERSQWRELVPVLMGLPSLGVPTIAPLVAVASQVDRFSFNPVRAASAD